MRFPQHSPAEVTIDASATWTIPINFRNSCQFPRISCPLFARFGNGIVGWAPAAIGSALAGTKPGPGVSARRRSPAAAPGASLLPAIGLGVRTHRPTDPLTYWRQRTSDQ